MVSGTSRQRAFTSRRKIAQRQSGKQGKRDIHRSAYYAQNSRSYEGRFFYGLQKGAYFGTPLFLRGIFRRASFSSSLFLTPLFSARRSYGLILSGYIWRFYKGRLFSMGNLCTHPYILYACIYCIKRDIFIYLIYLLLLNKIIALYYSIDIYPYQEAQGCPYFFRL